VQVLGGAFRDSEVGIWLRGGWTHVGPDDGVGTMVSGNGLVGVAIGAGPDRGAAPVPVPGVVLERVAVARNRGTGVALSQLDEAVSAVAFLQCDVYGNGRTSRVLSTGSPGAKAPVGGMLLAGASGVPLAYFGGNRLWSNAGDQLAIESAGSWTLGPTYCGFESNRFSCVASGSKAVRSSGGASVHVPFNEWPAPGSGAWLDPASVTTDRHECFGLSDPPEPACLP
jgi:hypothetical protein